MQCIGPPLVEPPLTLAPRQDPSFSAVTSASLPPDSAIRFVALHPDAPPRPARNDPPRARSPRAARPQVWNLFILEISDAMIDLKLVTDFLHSQGGALGEFDLLFRHASQAAEM